MTHDEIQRRELPELYVRGRLDEAERAAFEEHYFHCDECFAQTETLQRFVDGVHDAVAVGKIPAVEDAVSFGWFRPAFFLACAASLLLAIAAGWILFVERPRMELALERQHQDAEILRERLRTLETARDDKQIARGPEPNLPLVMLESSRAAGFSSITLPAAADRFAIWVEPPPTSAAGIYRLEMLTSSGELVRTVEGLKKNAYGAVAASVPSDAVRAGSYRVRLYAVTSAASVLVGEYRLDVRK